MDSEIKEGALDLQLSSKFMTGEELVALRKPKEQINHNIGIKFSSPNQPSIEKEAVECALENLKEILSQKRGARICDLIKAEWNEELNAVVTDKLKGKFAQHMGRRTDDKIVLSAEESLFLLENGCIEIMNGKVPMSTEEAYATMLKGGLQLEKYHVYSYLSQLGFIVVSHQKVSNKETSKRTKAANSEKCKRKRADSSPPHEEQSNKRITFSGALSEKDASSTVSTLPGVDICDNNTALPPKDNESSAEAFVNDAQLESQVCATNDLKEPQKVNISHDTKESRNFENTVMENQTVDGKNNSEPASNSRIEEMNIDSQSSEVVFLEHTEKPGQTEDKVDETEFNGETEFDIEKETGISTEAERNDVEADSDKTEVDIDTADSDKTEVDVETNSNKPEINAADSNEADLAAADDERSTGFCDFQNSIENSNPVGNERSSDVMSCSSSSDSYKSEDKEGEDSGDICMDDDVTLLEVTKKETTPLAVIDLLSDDEAEQNPGADKNSSSDSDDEIKIIKVCNGSAVNGKSHASGSARERKIKNKKINNCKMEEAGNQNANNLESVVQFPDFFRKDVACVPRPFPHLLPLHVQVNKEVYILDFKKSSQGQAESRPQARLWNSFREMQEYQHARRRNNNFSRFQQRVIRNRHHLTTRPYNDHMSRNHRQTFHQENANHWRNLSRNRAMDVDCDNSSPHSRPNSSDFPNHNLSRGGMMDMDYRDIRSSQDRGRDHDYRGPLSQEERKPFRTSGSPVAFGNSNRFSNQSDANSNFHVPHLTNSSSVNSVISIGHAGLGFTNQPMSYFNRNNFSGSMPFMETQDFATQVHRTAYSYATTLLSSMLGPGFNPNNLPQLSPFPPNRNIPPFPPFPNNINEPQPVHLSPAGSEYVPSVLVLNTRQSHREEHHPYRRPPRGNPFPCTFRNVTNKTSWEDLRVSVGMDNAASDHSSDIEEIPINLNEFLWNVSNICPLVKPGTKHQLSDVFKTLKLTKMANLTDKNSRNDKCFVEDAALYITYDVYLPGTNFKKSNPGVPKYRIIVTRASSPIPKYSEIALLQREWNDGAALQIAVVDNGDISFLSFKSLVLPDISEK